MYDDDDGCNQCMYTFTEFQKSCVEKLHHFYLVVLGGKKAVEVHAAVWVPDGDATICMHCKKTQFTLINRRVSFYDLIFVVLFSIHIFSSFLASLP